MILIDHMAVCKMMMSARYSHLVIAIPHTSRRLIITDLVIVTIQTCWEKFAVYIFILMFFSNRSCKHPIITSNII